MPDLRVEVRPAPRPPLAERDFELCEHKGVGHPDSIADGACEAAAVALTLRTSAAWATSTWTRAC